MAKPARDAAYWKRAREEMNTLFEAEKKKFDEAERQKQELRARRRAAEAAERGRHVVDIRWNSVAVPVTSGAGGHMVTVAASPRKRRRWRWS